MARKIEVGHLVLKQLNVAPRDRAAQPTVTFHFTKNLPHPWFATNDPEELRKLASWLTEAAARLERWKGPGDPRFGFCAECDDFVDNQAMCVSDPSHNTGYRRCASCQGETVVADGETCVECDGAGIRPRA